LSEAKKQLLKTSSFTSRPQLGQPGILKQPILYLVRKLKLYTVLKQITLHKFGKNSKGEVYCHLCG